MSMNNSKAFDFLTSISLTKETQQNKSINPLNTASNSIKQVKEEKEDELKADDNGEEHNIVLDKSPIVVRKKASSTKTKLQSIHTEKSKLKKISNLAPSSKEINSTPMTSGLFFLILKII